jgi:glycosyltransferase involved in cell wall biosynthesis
MRLLIIHNEGRDFAGAERVLAHFLDGLVQTDIHVTIAAVRESRMSEVIPAGMETIWIPGNRPSSVRAIRKQFTQIVQASRRQPFDLVHGWAARDWELTALVRAALRRPAVGTLHDHPRARFISRTRQVLMRWCARVGLNAVACVSGAVRSACEQSGYQRGKLHVIHNGLPAARDSDSDSGSRARPYQKRLGYLGVFSERKGLRGLFSILNELSSDPGVEWEMWMAGGAQDEEGEQMLRELKDTYAARDWWGRVKWCGWVRDAAEFLQSIDLLICPSSEFDPFPTVLIEAGRAGLPVLASNVGGIPEIIQDGGSGWLFEAGEWSKAAGLLQRLLMSEATIRAAGTRASERVRDEFSLTKMVAKYSELYSTLNSK